MIHCNGVENDADWIFRRLISALESTTTILNDLQQFNKNEWVVRYPYLREEPQSINLDKTAESAPVDEPVKRKSMRRSLSLTFADDPASSTEVVWSRSKTGLPSSMTLASIPETDNKAVSESNQREPSC